MLSPFHHLSFYQHLPCTSVLSNVPQCLHFIVCPPCQQLPKGSSPSKQADSKAQTALKCSKAQIVKHRVSRLPLLLLHTTTLPRLLLVLLLLLLLPLLLSAESPDGSTCKQIIKHSGEKSRWPGNWGRACDARDSLTANALFSFLRWNWNKILSEIETKSDQNLKKNL